MIQTQLEIIDQAKQNIKACLIEQQQLGINFIGVLQAAESLLLELRIQVDRAERAAKENPQTAE